MKAWLKKHFIPHSGNDHRPHFLHRDNMRQMAGVVLLFELILFILPVLNFSGLINTLNLGAVLPGILSTLTNVEREKNNLSELVVSPVLTAAAQQKAEDMAAKSYFAHTSPEGLNPWYWFQKVGYGYSYAGENLAVNFIDSQDVTVAWMNSPTHKANIVGQYYKEVGTGMATGMYEGHETVFVAQLYGTPVVHAGVTSPTPSNSASLPASGGLRRDQNLSASAPSQVVSVPIETEVLGEAEPVSTSNGGDKILQEPKFWEKVFSSPRHAMNGALYAVLAIILIALFLNVFIKFEYQHPDLILNGAVLAVFIFGIYFTNNFVSQNNLKTSFLAFDNIAPGNSFQR